MTTGGYWHDLRQKQPATEATGAGFQDDFIGSIREMIGIGLKSRRRLLSARLGLLWHSVR
jgi:hypothetical protein